MTSEIEHQAFIAMQYNPPAPTLDHPDAVVAGARAMYEAYFDGPWDGIPDWQQEQWVSAFAAGLEAWTEIMRGEANAPFEPLDEQPRTTRDAA